MDALANLPFLLFCLGAGLALAGRIIAIPTETSAWLGTLLVLLLGIKGGQGLAQTAEPGLLLPALGGGLIAGLAIPLLCFVALRVLPGWNTTERAAAAGHFGSVSVATFVAMLTVLDERGVATSDVMIAVMALMEAPALLVALVIATRQTTGAGAGAVRSALTNAPMLLLLGCMAAGYWVGQVRPDASEVSLVLDWLPGLLCVYLLLLGQKAGTLLRQRGVGWPDAAFALVWPLLAGGIGWLIGSALGLSGGNLALLAILSASASYIVAPAVLSLALPDVPLTRIQVMVIGVTFPANLIVGIPLWAYLSGAV